MLENSQQPPSMSTGQTKQNQIDTMPLTAPALNATSSQTFICSQSRTTHPLRRQPIKNYSNHIHASKIYFQSG